MSSMRGQGRRNWRSSAATTETPAPVQAVSKAANSDVKMIDISEEQSRNGTTSIGGEEEKEARRRPWEKPGGLKVKRKKVPGARNLKIRRYVQPKNAVMCLNELQPGVLYVTEQEGGLSQPFSVSVEIDSQKYRGFGTTKFLAKQAAAEAALISFVKPPVVKQPAATDETETEPKEQDKTPWAALASFAIYKLFNDWRYGRVGMCPPSPAQLYGNTIPSVTAAEKEEIANATAFTEAITAHLDGRPQDSNLEGQAGGANIPKVAKQLPTNAAAMHPVMVLHQMKPGLQYNKSILVKEGKNHFTVNCEIDGQNFVGEGMNLKKAKFTLAKTALSELYDVETTFEPTAA